MISPRNGIVKSEFSEEGQRLKELIDVRLEWGRMGLDFEKPGGGRSIHYGRYAHTEHIRVSYSFPK